MWAHRWAPALRQAAEQATAQLHWVCTTNDSILFVMTIFKTFIHLHNVVISMAMLGADKRCLPFRWQRVLTVQRGTACRGAGEAAGRQCHSLERSHKADKQINGNWKDTHTHTLVEPSRDDCCCSGKIPEMIYLIVKALLRGIWPIPPAYDVGARRTACLYSG